MPLGAGRLLWITKMVISNILINWKEIFLYRLRFSQILDNYTASCTILEIHNFKSRKNCHQNVAQGLRLIPIDIVRFLKYGRKYRFYLKEIFCRKKQWRWQSCCRIRMKWYYLLNVAVFLVLKDFRSKIRKFLVFEKYKKTDVEGVLSEICCIPSSENHLFWSWSCLAGDCLSFCHFEWLKENHPRKRWVFKATVCQFCPRLAEVRSSLGNCF